MVRYGLIGFAAAILAAASLIPSAVRRQEPRRSVLATGLWSFNWVPRFKPDSVLSCVKLAAIAA